MGWVGGDFSAENIFETLDFPNAQCMVYIYIFTYIWPKFMVNVGKLGHTLSIWVWKQFLSLKLTASLVHEHGEKLEDGSLLRSGSRTVSFQGVVFLGYFLIYHWFPIIRPY